MRRSVPLLPFGLGLLGLLGLIGVGSAGAKKHKLPDICDAAKVKVGDLCALDVYDLRPTQFALGMSEIRCKKGRFEGMKSKDVRKYVLDNPVPVVLGPDPYAVQDDDERPISFYMYDHHHMGRALMDADIDSADKYVVVNVTTDFYVKGGNESVFWKTMVESNLLWLFDEKGLQPLNPFYLPMSLLRLQNDPYRSLAYLVRHAGGYKKLDVPFQDWIWGHFFAHNRVLPFNDASRHGDSHYNQGAWKWCDTAPNDEGTCLNDEDTILLAHVTKAVELAGSELAKSLPGYGKGEISNPKCGDDL